MGLSYIADVHISPLTVSDLRKEGFKISRITDFLPATSPDTKILDFARERNAVIITQDLDFSSLIALSGLTSPSLISIRVSNANPKSISQLLNSLLPQIQRELSEGAIISVDDYQYRVRMLPVR